MADAMTVTPQQLAAGAVVVPFYGYGKVNLNFDPNLIMPDGLMLALTAEPLVQTYREGHQ